MLAWALFLMSSTINIGFRHFLPAYVFMMIFASRAIAKERHWTQIACAAAMLATTAHAVAYHPNYLSYVNLPHDRAFLDVSDSNIDWGQSLKQVRRWLDENPLAGPVYLGYFGERTGSAIRHYLGNRVLELRPEDPAPDRGTLIISPVWLAGAGDAGERYAHLRDRPPDAVIGDCMLVYEFK
jgi:hypothetical protein